MTDKRTPNGGQEPSIEILLAVRGELYNELRSYRDKELQTFLFAFPVIGVGYTPIRSLAIRILLSAFTLVIGIYIVGNHYRMMRIKRRIANVQQELGVAGLLSGLSNGNWATKPFHKHLGTVVYMVLLLGETIGLWFVKIPAV